MKKVYLFFITTNVLSLIFIATGINALITDAYSRIVLLIGLFFIFIGQMVTQIIVIGKLSSLNLKTDNIETRKSESRDTEQIQ